MQQKLSDLIVMNSKFLGLEGIFSEDDEIILKYFLDKDFKTFLGSDTFLINSQEETEENLDFFKREDGKIIIEYKGVSYSLECDNETDCIYVMTLKTGEPRVKISYERFANAFINEVYSFDIDRAKRTYERQIIYAGKGYDFEYKKITEENGAELRYPTFVLKQVLVKKKDIEYFKLFRISSEYDDDIVEKIKSQTEHKRLVGIRTRYEYDDIKNYLPQIFDMLEQRTDPNFTEDNAKEKIKKLFKNLKR